MNERKSRSVSEIVMNLSRTTALSVLVMLALTGCTEEDGNKPPELAVSQPTVTNLADYGVTGVQTTTQSVHEVNGVTVIDTTIETNSNSSSKTLKSTFDNFKEASVQIIDGDTILMTISATNATTTTIGGLTQVTYAFYYATGPELTPANQQFLGQIITSTMEDGNESGLDDNDSPPAEFSLPDGTKVRVALVAEEQPKPNQPAGKYEEETVAGFKITTLPADALPAAQLRSVPKQPLSE